MNALTMLLTAVIAHGRDRVGWVSVAGWRGPVSGCAPANTAACSRFVVAEQRRFPDLIEAAFECAFKPQTGPKPAPRTLNVVNNGISMARLTGTLAPWSPIPRAGQPALPEDPSTSPLGDGVLHDPARPGGHPPSEVCSAPRGIGVESDGGVQRGAHPGDHAGHRGSNARRRAPPVAAFIGRDTHGLSGTRLGPLRWKCCRQRRCRAGDSADRLAHPPRRVSHADPHPQPRPDSGLADGIVVKLSVINHRATAVSRTTCPTAAG